MTAKLVYHCDRTQGHNLSYEKASGETDDPVAKGWLVASLINHGGKEVLIQIHYAGARPDEESDHHFCSPTCLNGWVAEKLVIIEDQPTEEEPK